MSDELLEGVTADAAGSQSDGAAGAPEPEPAGIPASEAEPTALAGVAGSDAGPTALTGVPGSEATEAAERDAAAESAQPGASGASSAGAAAAAGPGVAPQATAPPGLDWSRLSWRQCMELDACARCGECQNWCPVFEHDQREGVLPRGKAGVFRRLLASEGGWLQRLLAGGRPSDAEFEQLVSDLYECSVCGQCHYVCPTGIDTMELWEALRAMVAAAGRGPLQAHLGLHQSIVNNDNPWQQPRTSRDRWAVRAAKGKNAEIERVSVFGKDLQPGSAEVLLFVGCTASFDMNIKQVAINSARVLQAAGVEFGILGEQERCCSSVMMRVGLRDEFEERARANIEQLNALGVRTLVTSCSGCFKTIGHDYPRLAPLDFEVMHVSQYMVRLLDEGRLELAESAPRTVTYHDPCHLGRHSGVYDAPREVLRRLPGVELREMPRNRENALCCGAGGGLKAGFPDLQNRISLARVKEAEETGAEALVSSCPFCYQGLQVGLESSGSDLRMMDLTELVADSTAPPAPGE